MACSGAPDSKLSSFFFAFVFRPSRDVLLIIAFGTAATIAILLTDAVCYRRCIVRGQVPCVLAFRSCRIHVRPIKGRNSSAIHSYTSSETAGASNEPFPHISVGSGREATAYMDRRAGLHLMLKKRCCKELYIYHGSW